MVSFHTVAPCVFRTVCPSLFWGFPGGASGKESACHAGDASLIPGLGRSPGEGNGNSLQYSCLENPHGQRSLAKSDTTKHTQSGFFSVLFLSDSLSANSPPHIPTQSIPPTTVCIQTHLSSHTAGTVPQGRTVGWVSRIPFTGVVFILWDLPGGSNGKQFACNVGDLGLIFGLRDPLEEEMATHSSLLAWRIPWTEEPGGL